MAGDIFEALPSELTKAGQQTMNDTVALQQQSNSLMGQIDDTCKSLPPFIYQALEPTFLAWNSMFNRSNEERDRLSTVLQATGKAIEQLEQKIKASFTPTSK